MAQTTSQITFRDCEISISTNGSTWTDVSGFANSIGIGGGERNIGEFFTAEGDTPLIGAGKRSALEVTSRIVYTEGAAEPYEVIRQAYEAGTVLYVRFSPKGGDATEFMFTSDAGYVRNPVYPQGEVQSGEPIAFEFTIVTPKITKSVISA